MLFTDEELDEIDKEGSSHFWCECGGNGCNAAPCEGKYSEWVRLNDQRKNDNQFIVRKKCNSFINHTYIALIAQSENLALVEGDY